MSSVYLIGGIPLKKKMKICSALAFRIINHFTIFLKFILYFYRYILNVVLLIPHID